MNKIDDVEILGFLKAAYFGDTNDLMEAASNRAYRDMCRTIKFNCIDSGIRINLKREVTELLKTEITDSPNKDICSAEKFDEWHMHVCNEIIDKYKMRRINLTVGQAQKWLNMTVKYLYVLGEKPLESAFAYIHVPIDNIVIKMAKDDFGIDMPEIVWSKWDNYEEYLQYQNKFRQKIEQPFKWEFENWTRNVK